jgi:hypothetical protein
MSYTTVVAGTTITASWSNANVRDQVVTPFTNSAARSSAITSPVDGMISVLTTTDRVDVYNGSSWSALVAPSNGALTSFTPTVTQSGSVTGTVNYGASIRTGRWIQGAIKFTVTGSGTASNTVVIGALPTTAASNIEVVGSAYIFDSSVPNVTFYVAYLASTTTIQLVYVNAGATGALSTFVAGSGANSGFTAGLASGDVISLNFMYEASADG